MMHTRAFFKILILPREINFLNRKELFETGQNLRKVGVTGVRVTYLKFQSPVTEQLVPVTN